MEPFRQPQLAITKVYTRTGDQGKTSLVGGARRFKDDPQIECYGTVDELNALLGWALEAARGEDSLAELRGQLLRIQHVLFNLGSILASIPAEIGPQQPRVREEDIQSLEREIDALTPTLPVLRSFVLPGGSELNARLHVCRTVCRRAERLVVAAMRENEGLAGECWHMGLVFLNRLSDALFVWSRRVLVLQACPETLWQPNQP